MKIKLKHSYIPILIISLFSNCNRGDNKSQNVNKTDFDSLAESKAIIEKYANENREKSLNSNTKDPFTQKKYVIAKITCKESVFGGFAKDGIPVKDPTEGGFPFYVEKEITHYSEINEIIDFDEDRKYKFLDNYEENLKNKGFSILSISKRECLVFDSYADASKERESLTEK